MSTEVASRSVSPQSMEFAKGLLNALHAMFGKKFLTHWEGVAFDELVGVWAHGFVGYTPKELKQGLDRCRGLEWPPSLPDFLALCRPKIDPERAWVEAAAGVWARERGEMGKWSDPVVYWAMVEGEFAYDLKHRTFKDCKARWTAELEHIQRIAQETPLLPIPEPRDVLPAPGASKTSKEEGRVKAAELHAMVAEVAKAQPSVHKSKAWAQRILDNPKGKSIASVKMAQRALPDYIPKSEADQDYNDELLH